MKDFFQVGLNEMIKKIMKYTRLYGNIEEFTSLLSRAVKQSKRLIKEHFGYTLLETVSAKNGPFLYLFFVNKTFVLILRSFIAFLSKIGLF